ncbi:hypothetical protein [Streptomyces aurantiogriseus]|uniref:N-acetylmuramoyl-L-alanine amidase n=1 Tax=Streptomyces aurantiogriseus TaxID=66870 RepID=A0A918L0I0_9ACTN|nr:hypothetical protein [Streptomyces aurantiogriseus]GGR61505.1 hypothetical protein GCM10010251_92950 [Streptomyces aurantiogriseus]
MAGTGPQKYPGASTAYFYQNRFGGDVMEVNVVVLHTTEGRNLPDYGGGASAPNLTAVPDFANRRLRWYQHFDIDRSSRALVNLSGGVATNTLNVVQVEKVGTCDPATHKKWQAAGLAHIYWPEAPDWALAGVAEFLRWMNAQHGVPLTGPSRWPAYPTSYANGGGQRLSFDQWEAFKGVCGHMHVPENTHGDPGAIDFPQMIALAKGTPTPPPEEADVALTTDEIDKIAAAVKAKLLGPDLVRTIVGTDNILAAPDGDTTNPYWAWGSFVTSEYKKVARIETKVDDVATKVDAIALGGVDLDALAAKVADLLAARLAQ